MRMSSVRLLPVAAGLCVLVAIAAMAARPSASQDPSDPSGLENLGRSHSVRGEYLLAIPLLRRACALYAENRDNDAAAENCLEALATALIYTSQFTEAESVLKRAQARQEASSETNPLRLSRTLALVALLQRWMGQYDDSNATLDRALTLRNGKYLESDDRVMLALLKGDLLWLAGDIPTAHRQYEVATTLPRSSLRESLDHLVALRRQAFAEDHLGNPARAAALADQADRAGAALLAECHDERGALLNDRAAIARSQGDYSRARELYQSALAHKTRCASVNGADVVTPLLNLALAAEVMGDAGEADKLYARAAQAWSARYSPSHPFVALAVDGLARVSLMQGSASQARQRWLRALSIRRGSLGEDHPEVAWSFTNLGQTDILLGNIKTAATSLERSAEIYTRTGVSDQPERFIRLLAARGELQLKLGNLSSAQDLLAQALATRLRFFGEAHPLSAEARADLARAQALVGREDLALESALMAEDVAKNHLRRSISYLPERQALMYAGVRPEGLNLAVSIAASGHKSPRIVFDAVVRSRAVVLDELETRSHIKSASDPNLDKLRERLTTARQRLANLTLRSVRDRVPTPTAILEDARGEAEVAERALAERSASFRLEQARAESGFDDVWRALPADSVLVSYLKYQHTALPKSGQSLKVVPPTESYVAFVATARDGAVAAVPLGSARVVDAMIADWRTVISAQAPPNELEYRKAAGGLRRQIWDPIAAFVKGASLVFVVPDGAINLVSFGALPVGNNYLLENVQGLHYLSAERDLLSANGSKPRGGLLAIGGVEFANQPIVARGSTSPIASSRSAPAFCSGSQLTRFDALPGTTGEVADISAVWNSSGSVNGSALVLRGSSATEDAFKREASGRAILHLATHGFFFDGGCVPAARGTRSVGGLVSARPAVAASPQTVERQFALSGLALAGANHRASAKPGAEDGILTAEEVVSLNLDGVEWAVLSACDTGLGRIRAGEGVFGLRRAFQIAGVRTVIMSLWAVDDEATRLWMRSLYEGRLVRHLSTTRAVRDASIAVLADRRKKGLSAHPFYWAGFVAAGSWR
jgi:CHAT domain-containing protein/tetratricopeptide (TPR) repeat protein